MEFRLLGPLEARHDGVPISLGSTKQRSVLAILLLRANEVVSRDSLIDELWGEEAPVSAEHTLQAYISRLRKELRAKGVHDDVLVTRARGYLLRVEHDELDLHRFERLAEEGRRALSAGSPERAAEKLEEALALWRGPALADLAVEPFARVDVERLEEQRLAALEDRFDAALALGEAATLVAELRALVSQHPMRERLRAQLMLALYRSDRQADALAAYQDARDYAVEELGLEPSTRLRALQQAILAQDVSLTPSRSHHGPIAVLTRPTPVVDRPPAAGAGRGGAESAPHHGETRHQPRRTRSRQVLAGAVIALLALAGAAAVTLLSLRDGGGGTVARHALAVFDRDSGDLRWQLPLDRAPDSMIVHGNTALIGFDEGEVLHVDLKERRLVARLPMPEGQQLGPVVGKTMWTTGPRDKVVPVDIRFGTAGRPITLNPLDRTTNRLGNAEESHPWIAVGGGAVWVAYGSPPRVARIDPDSKRVVARIELPLPANAGWCCGVIAYGDGDVWVTDRSTGHLWRIDPASNDVVATGTLNGSGVEDLAAGGGYGWAPRTDDAGVWQIDRALQAPRLIPTGVYPVATTFAAGTAWVANRNDATVTGVDPSTRETTTIQTSGAPVAVSAQGDDIVVALVERPPDPYTGLEGPIATVLAHGDPLLEPDPAVGAPDYFDRIQIHDAIDLRLVRYDDADGDGVQTIVPDGADLPQVSDGGRTWRFRIRDGYRFSPPSGAAVTAEVFRDSIERALSPGWGEWPPFPNYLEDLEGIDEYRAGARPHISGLRIDGNTLVFRLRRPLRDLSARLALQPYAAVPPGTPVVTPRGVRDPVPSAGPYYVASHVRNSSAVLRRNPNYPGPRKGGFEAFVWRLLIANDPAIARLEDGEGDIVTQRKEQVTGVTSPQMVRDGELDRRYGAGDEPRYLRAGLPFTWFIRFNTLREPFSEPRLRKAVSLAVDRTELAAYWDGVPADLFIPPGVASHRPQGRLLALTAQPTEARRLSGGFRGTVTLATDPRAAQQRMAEAIKRQLARIGIGVRIVYDWGRRQNAGRYDMVLDTWLFDYMDVGMTFGPILDPVHAGYDQFPVVDPPIFRDPYWISRIRAADRLTGARRDRAYADLDRDLAAGPLPIAPLGHGEWATFVNERVGCMRVVGVNGQLDLAALCPREHRSNG